MLFKKVLVVLCALSLILSLPLLAQANDSRLSGMGLSEATLLNTDWMVQDPANIIYNPAYINMYGNYIEANSNNYTGSVPFGTGILKLNNSLTLGVVLNYPYYNSLLNINYVESLPINFSSFANAPIDAETFSTYKAMALGGLNLGGMNLGFSFAFGNSNGLDLSTVFTNPNDATQDYTTTIKTSNSQMAFGAGVLFNKFGPIENLGVDAHLILPSLTRENTRVQVDALNYTRSISTDSAMVLDIGTTGTINTSTSNAIIGRFEFLSDNCKVTVLDKEDLNGNGTLTDAGDEFFTDNHAETKSVIRFGAVDQYKITGEGFIFLGAYFSSTNNTEKRSGKEEDGYLNGPNYNDPYDKAVSITEIPVIVGAEFPVANWLKVRFSASKSVYKSETTTITTNNYTVGTEDIVNKRVDTFTSFLDSGATLTLGTAVTLGKVSIDWFIQNSFVSNGGLLSSETYDDMSYNFTVSIK